MINAQNNQGDTALHIALYAILNAQNSNDMLTAKNIAITLLKNNANSFIPNANGVSAKRIAYGIGDSDIMTIIYSTSLRRLNL